MKIEESLVRKIVISDIKFLDPISLYLEDYGAGRGKITITCFNDSWSNYWGAMGEYTISQFVTKCDNHYLFQKFSPNVSSNIDDPSGLEEFAKKHILEHRREDSISKEEARKLYDKCYELNEEYDIKNLDSGTYADIMYDIFGEEWYDYPIPKKPNAKYEYFCRILNVVKEALKEKV